MRDRRQLGVACSGRLQRGPLTAAIWDEGVQIDRGHERIRHLPIAAADRVREIRQDRLRAHARGSGCFVCDLRTWCVQQTCRTFDRDRRRRAHDSHGQSDILQSELFAQHLPHSSYIPGSRRGDQERVDAIVDVEILLHALQRHEHRAHRGL